MDKLYYDRANKKFYVKELNTEKCGDILVVTDERYVDVTDEIAELFQEHITKVSKLLLKTIEKKETYDFIRNATLKRQCYNCALKKDCEREHPDTYEPIGTCDKWEDENGLRTLID